MPHNPWANTQVREYLEGPGIYVYVKIKHCCHQASAVSIPNETGICILFPRLHIVKHKLRYSNRVRPKEQQG